MRRPSPFRRGKIALLAGLAIGLTLGAGDAPATSCKDEYIAASGSAQGHAPATGEAIRNWQAKVKARFGRAWADYNNAKTKHVPFGCKPLRLRPGFSSCAVRAAPCKP
jgi:hypothetical protein